MPKISLTLHPALGRMVRVEGCSARPLLLTPLEAQTVARALEAVRQGRSSEREISLCPIGSDDFFQAEVGPDGIQCGPTFVPWTGVEPLAAQLLSAAGLGA